ncbi:MAG: PEP/pyruvate-binding domain-containing protein [Propioniciclava sp.]
MAAVPLTLSLTDARVRDIAVAGGKGANLGELLGAGFAVPAGFVVTTAAYESAVAELSEPGQEAVAAVVLPTDVVAAIAQDYAALGGQVAVRSSATAEDLPGAAFAGQQDTFLGVTGTDAVVEAVRRCWASLWTERAISYRERLGIDAATVSIAVVVQQLVPADHAGVMFTADPVTGQRDRIIIDSSAGLGEAVVAGLVTPDHAVLDADDQILSRTAGQAGTVVRARPEGGTVSTIEDSTPLTDADLAALAGIGRAVARHFGRPQDIEWALAAGQIAVLQARPMTALPPAPIPLTRRQRITGPVILELLPRRPYPLELDVWTMPIIRHVQSLAGGLAGLAVNHAAIIPGRDAVVQEFVPPNPHPTPRTPGRVVRTLWRSRRDPADWERDPRLHRYREQLAGWAATEPGALSWAELVARPQLVQAELEVMTALRVEHLPGGFAAMARLRILATALGHRKLFAALLMQAETVTQRLNDDLAALAVRVRSAIAVPSPDSEQLWQQVQADPGLRAEAAQFLERYGHRETGSILLVAEPSWAAAPATVMGLITVLFGQQPESRPEVFEQALETLLSHPRLGSARSQRWVRALVAKASLGVAVREDTHFEITRAMPVVRSAVLELGRRLAASGVLAAAEDVWYLTWDDIRAVGDPDVGGADLRGPAERRRAAYAELAGSPLIASTTLYRRRSGAEALVTGVGGGNGQVRGRVRVIGGPAEFGALQSGEVLVCPSTNPAWTPLFTRAAAVVVDHGGFASHAAIVAREYGIPSVMGTGNGTTILQTGMPVVVDGDHGTVRPDDLAPMNGPPGVSEPSSPEVNPA